MNDRGIFPSVSPVRSTAAQARDSRCMKLSFGERLFDLAANGLGATAFPFQKAQLIPQADDLSFLASVHGVSLGKPQMRTNQEHNSSPCG